MKNKPDWQLFAFCSCAFLLASIAHYRINTLIARVEALEAAQVEILDAISLPIPWDEVRAEIERYKSDHDLPSARVGVVR